MNKKIVLLPDAELEIMKIIWKEKTPISTSEIKDILDQTKNWNISTLQTLLNRLIDRGFLSTYKEGKNKCYEVLMKEDDYLAVENQSFLDKVNGKSILKMVNSLYNSNSITLKDLEELEEFIARKKGDSK